jgi:pimeloyl-ACP methyl ester carboxylesterase
MLRPIATLAALLVAASMSLVCASTACGQKIEAAAAEEPQLDGPTFGGTQLWTDRLIYGEWRIQQNAVTGHYRLLDDENVRRISGTYGQCRTEFLKLKKELELPPLKSTAVITLHGLGAWRGVMQPLANYLAKEGDWTSINFGYASTRKSVADHALALKHVIDNLEGVEHVHLVAHSLGNIVVRRYFDLRNDQKYADRHGPKIERVVMIGPPNNGSAIARMLENSKLFEIVGGTSAQQLGEAWDELQPKLATPPHFGIIAGSTLRGNGTNPLVPGDDDMMVGVEETKLPGAEDFLTVSSTHTLMLFKGAVREATLRFLQDGYFVSADKKQPITATAEVAGE